jgi:hypothetical protein
MSYTAPPFITHHEVESFLGGGARGKRQRQRLQERGLLPEPAWLPRVDRLRVGLLPTFALAGLFDDELGAAPKTREMLLSLTLDALSSPAFRGLSDVVAQVIREIVGAERGLWAFDALIERLAHDATGELSAWTELAEDVEEELHGCGVLLYSELGRVESAQDDVVVVSMPDARLERFPAARAATAARNGVTVAVEHVKVMATEREFLMPAFLTPDPAASLDWSQVADHDWEAMFGQQDERADAWELAADAALPADDDVPMVISSSRSGRDAAMALLAEHRRA